MPPMQLIMMSATPSVQEHNDTVSRRRSVTFAPPGQFIKLHNIPLSPDREWAKFVQSPVMNGIKETVVPLPAEVMRIVLRMVARDDELDSLSLGSRDGAELLHMRSSGREETQSEACIQTIWDRQLDRVYHEHLAGCYDYACALLNALDRVDLDVRSWRTGVQDEDNLSDETTDLLEELRALSAIPRDSWAAN